MTRTRVSDVLDRLGQWDGNFIAVKTNWPPDRTDPAERAASVAANFETVASLIASGPLRTPVPAQP
jgi:hypothetical protein